MAETDGPFAEALLANAGATNGVQEGYYAENDRGLVGRVVQVGQRSSRILKITDFNSRVPVMQQIIPFGFRDGRDVAIISVREKTAGAFLVEPSNFTGGQQENAAKDQAERALWMGDGIGQGQGRSPRAAKQDPFFNAKLFANRFHIADQAPSIIALQLRMRSRFSTAALVDENDAIHGRVEEASHFRARTPAWAAMTAILGKLQNKGYIEIAGSADDRRRKIVSITSAGRKARERGIKAMAPLAAIVVEQQDISKLAKIIPVLQTLREFLDAERNAVDGLS